MVHYQVFDAFYCLVLGVSVLDLGAPFVVEMYDRHAKDRLLHLRIALVVLLHHFSEKQCLVLQLLIEGGHEDLGLLGLGERKEGSGGVGFDEHLILFEEELRQVVGGVFAEVGFVLFVGLQVYLSSLQYSQRLPKAVRYLFVDEVDAFGGEVELL